MTNKDAINVLKLMAPDLLSCIKFGGYNETRINDFKEAYELAIKALGNNIIPIIVTDDDYEFNAILDKNRMVIYGHEYSTKYVKDVLGFRRISGARISGTRISGARISGARISMARISGARISGARKT